MKMLEFLYTDIVTDIPPDVAVPLLIASEQYLLDRLKGLCEDAIRKVRQPPTTHQKYTDSTLRHTYPYNAQMLTHPHPRTLTPPHPHTLTPSRASPSSTLYLLSSPRTVTARRASRRYA